MTTKAQGALIAEDIEWGIVEGENTEFAAKYPRFQWVHGSKQAAGFMKTGGLFVSSDEFPNFPGEGFNPTTLITREGDEIQGFAASAAKLAVIRIKHQWVKDENYGRNVPLAQVLCVVKGCDDLINISLKGANKSLEFQKAFNQHLGQNVALANKTRPSGAPPIEPFALWFPIEACEQVPATSKDGKANSPVTPPIMTKPETLDHGYVVSLWVGATNYKSFAGFYKETAAWQKQLIWEKRDGSDDHEAPAFSGPNGDGITPQQADQLHGLIEAKGLDLEEVKQMILAATDGATSTLKMLTKEEAQTLLDTMRSY